MKSVSLFLFFFCLFVSAVAQSDEAPVIVTVEANVPDTRAGQGARSEVNAETLRRSGLDSLDDLRGRAPNLQVRSSGARSFGDIYTMRGLGNTQFFSNPAVVVYVDDVPMPDAFALSTRLYQSAGAEIYRGAQGPFFGRNAQAGVISLRTPQPGDLVTAEASYGYGSFESHEASLSVSGPVVDDRLYVALGGYYAESEGYLYNPVFGEEVDDRQAAGGRMLIRYTPNEDWALTLAANGETFNDGPLSIKSVNTAIDPDHHRNSSDQLGETQVDRLTQSLKIERFFDEVEVILVTARHIWDMDPNKADLDLATGISSGFSADTSFVQDQEQWIQEMRVRSIPFAEDTVSWQAGVFLLSGEVDGDTERNTFVPGTFPTTIREGTAYELQEYNAAVFGDLTWHVTDWFDAGFGLRVDLTRKTMERERVNNTVATFGGAVISNTTTLVSSNGERVADYLSASPILRLRYGAAPWLDFHGRIGLGFKPGGFSPFADNPREVEYDVEHAWVNEFGASVDLFEERLRFSVTGFWYDIFDYQFERTAFDRGDPASTSSNYIVLNANEVISRGVEMELAAELVEGLSLISAFGFSDTRFKDHVDVVNPELMYEGNNVPYVPLYTLTTRLQYDHSSGFFTWAEFQAFGETYYDEANTDTFKESSYGLFNAGFGYQCDHFEIVFYGRNLTDTEYFTTIDPSIRAGWSVSLSFSD